MENKEDKEQLKVIQKEEERLEEIFDLKMILKNVNRINFFQKIVLKKLGIKYEDVQWNIFESFQNNVAKMHNAMKVFGKMRNNHGLPASEELKHKTNKIVPLKEVFNENLGQTKRDKSGSHPNEDKQI